ncbi:hypothetical protein ANCCAN_23818 [Ancylostoma caninum]|uniref:Uncharacterized protein n=1 Tax=Ancylostoma caninum TaxID=29170 RepID=A0A368FFR9_ANCCA|nr:hypothetical protein ANCCAN_23818 [Ancylostoma caninum]
MVGGSYAGSVYGQRRRRMSLLQTLRQQNRQLNDSGLEIHRQRTDSESTNRDTSSPPLNKSPPPPSPSKKTFASLKSKLFGKRDKHRVDGSSSFAPSEEHSQSCDIIGRSRKSPSTTNDSGRGSQAHLDNDRVIGETVAIIERPNDESDEVAKPYRRIRTSELYFRENSWLKNWLEIAWMRLYPALASTSFALYSFKFMGRRVPMATNGRAFMPFWMSLAYKI